MGKVAFAAGLMGVAMLFAGCRSTQVAEVQRSQEEVAWEKIIRENYPNYRPPRSAAPAVYDNTESRVSAQTYAKPAEAPVAEDKVQELEAVESAAPVNSDAVEVKTETPAAENEKAPEAKAETPAAETVAPVAPPDPADSTVYVVQSGDTLGKIAQKHYGSARHSNMIFKANGDILKDPNKLRPGMKLIVPKL